MVFVPLLVNAIVICVLTVELIAATLGLVSADQLLVSSILSGLLTFLSLKLSQETELKRNEERAVMQTAGNEISPEV